MAEQLDLFPEELERIYRSGDCYDLSKPPFEVSGNGNKFSKFLSSRIEFLKSLPEDRFHIFAEGHDGLPYIYDKEKGMRVRPNDTQRDYTTVMFGKKALYLHTLVAMFFLENDMPEVKLQVDHINNCPYDYRVSNLQWVTQSQNMKRMHERIQDDTT